MCGSSKTVLGAFDDELPVESLQDGEGTRTAGPNLSMLVTRIDVAITEGDPRTSNDDPIGDMYDLVRGILNIPEDEAVAFVKTVPDRALDNIGKLMAFSFTNPLGMASLAMSGICPNKFKKVFEMFGKEKIERMGLTMDQALVLAKFGLL